MKIGVLFGLSLLVSAGAFILKELKCSLSPLLSFFFCVVTVSEALILLNPVLIGIKALGNEWENIGNYLPYLFKGAGISLVSGVSSDLCREADLTSASKGVDFLGRCALISLAFPLAGEVISVCLEMVREA